MTDFETWCYQDTGKARLNNEQLLELAGVLREINSIDYDYIKKYSERFINYQTIKSTLEEDKEFKEKISIEKTKYQKLAEQIETERKQIEQDFDKSKYQKILSEIKKKNPYASFITGNSEEEIESNLRTKIKNEINKLKREIDEQTKKINQERENYENQYAEIYYKQILSELIAKGAEEIPELEQFKESVNHISSMDKYQYKTKVQNIKDELLNQMQKSYKDCKEKIEEINKEKEKKINEIQNDFENFTSESFALLERNTGKQLDFDENYYFNSQQDIEEYFENLEPNLQELLEKDYENAMQEYQKAVKNQENYKEKMIVDRKKLANEILDKFEDEIPIDTSRIKDELSRKNYNSINDIEQAIKQELTKEQEIQNKFESGDFSDLFEQNLDSAENQGQGLSKEFYEMADSILKESLTNLDQESREKLEKLGDEIENLGERVNDTKNKLSYGAERFIKEALGQTKKNQEGKISEINFNCSQEIQSIHFSLFETYKNKYGFESTEFDFRDNPVGSHNKNLIFDEARQYFYREINETEKKIKKEFEKNYNKKMNKFNNKIDSSKEQIEERFYDNFNIRQNGKDIFNEDINDQIITQAAESLVGKAKEKIALEYKEKLEEMLEKKNECDGMVENIRENLLDEYKDKAMEEINSKYFDQLIERGLIEVGKDGVYEVNKKGVTELIAKKAFDETMKILGGNRRSGRGTHKSKTMGFGEPILDKTKKTNKVSRSLAILPTMRRSIIRRAVKPNSPIIIEDDLVEYDNLKNISYATVIAIDKSSSMEGENMESAKNCALSLAYYMKKKHRKDKIDYLTFEDYVEEIKFEDILDIYPNNYTNTGAAIKLGREILDKYGRKEKLLYLITDGYPQGRYDESTEERQEFALKQARKLKDDNIELVEILLNNGSSRMVGWGKKIATEANGTLFHVKDPSNLGAFVIDNFSRRKRGG